MSYVFCIFGAHGKARVIRPVHLAEGAFTVCGRVVANANRLSKTHNAQMAHTLIDNFMCIHCERVIFRDSIDLHSANKELDNG